MSRCVPIVEFVRDICSRELGLPRDYPFFHLDYLPGESADDALARLFLAERRALTERRRARFSWTDEDVVLVLCHG